MRDATLVTRAAELEAAVFRMRGAPRLAIDTEFMRERTYYPQLCLVQVATDADCFLVDPLGGLDLNELYTLLAETRRTKILHAARQDLEVLYLAGGRVPQPVFDTQVAAALLGLAPQVGYAELVARRLGHSIDKAQTRTDWSRRPLTPEQLAYAADDVHHLLQLHADLQTELETRGRAQWLIEETAEFADEARYRTAPAEAWRRVKGYGRLKPVEQSVVRALAQWREERAIAANRPRGWILPDEALVALAGAAPGSAGDLANVRGLPPAVVRKRGDELHELIVRARAAPVDSTDTSARRPEPSQLALAARLMQVVREVATKLEIAPELLATRRDLEAIAQSGRDSPVLRGWRRGAIGDRLLAELESTAR